MRVLFKIIALSMLACSPFGCTLASSARSASASTFDAARAQMFRAEARDAHRQNDFVRCAQLFAQAASVEPGDPGDAYDIACCRTRAADYDGAFASLERAVELGYHDVEHMRADGDLERLRSKARWRALVDKATAAQKAYLRTVNPELYRLFKEEHEDRSHSQTRSRSTPGEGPKKQIWVDVTERAAVRRERVKQILDAGGAKAADDFYHAGVIFQRGRDTSDFQTAHRLALEAVALDPRHRLAKWLAAAAKDRELMSKGKPQLYGTQFRRENGRWVLYPVEPSITDEERAKWSVLPLELSRKRVEAMNQQESAKPGPR